MNVRCQALSAIVFCLNFLCAARIINQSSMLKTVEQANGITFVSVVTCTNGICQDRWLIDDKPVDRTAYEETILEAEKAERRKLREQEYRDQQEEFAFKNRTRQQLSQKLLRGIIQQLDKQLAKLAEYQLQPYVRYCSETVSQEQEQYDLLINELLPQARKLVDVTDFEASELFDLADRLTTREMPIKRLVGDAVERAIQRCDDTALLKKLLVLTF